MLLYTNSPLVNAALWLQADRSMESLFAELASNGVLVSPPKVELADYLGGYSFMGATLEKAGIIPDPSLAQVRGDLTSIHAGV
jgi:hypothetical protein